GHPDTRALLFRLTAKRVVGHPVLGSERCARPHLVVEVAVELRRNARPNRGDFRPWRLSRGGTAGRKKDHAKGRHDSSCHRVITIVLSVYTDVRANGMHFRRGPRAGGWSGEIAEV